MFRVESHPDAEISSVHRQIGGSGFLSLSSQEGFCTNNGLVSVFTASQQDVWDSPAFQTVNSRFQTAATSSNPGGSGQVLPPSVNDTPGPAELIPAW